MHIGANGRAQSVNLVPLSRSGDVFVRGLLLGVRLVVTHFVGHQLCVTNQGLQSQ